MNELSYADAAILLLDCHRNDRDLPELIFWNDNSRQLSGRTLCAVDFSAVDDPARYPFWTTEGDFYKHCAFLSEAGANFSA